MVHIILVHIFMVHAHFFDHLIEFFLNTREPELCEPKLGEPFKKN